MFSFAITTLLFVTCYFLKRWLEDLRANPKRLPLPPGPKPLPFIGSLLDFPTSYYWLPYAEWSKKYGDVMYFHVLGQDFIVLDSVKAVEDLLEARSAIYSDRPRLPMLVEL
jgi:hypothetical protein